MTSDGFDDLSPSEERLFSLLLLLQEEAPRPGEALTDAIMRQARRQMVLKRAIDMLSSLLGGIFDGALLLLGPRRRATPGVAY